MMVTKGEFLSDRKASIKTWTKDAISHVTEQIYDHWDGSKASVSLPPGSNRERLTILIAEMRAAGWTVDHQSDQRDGDSFLTIS